MSDSIYGPGDLVAGKYAIQRVIGEGGFGIVYLAHDQQVGDTCALKTFRDYLLPDAKAREAFRHELALWLSLGRHPAIVEARFIDSESHRLFVKMEFVKPDAHGRTSLQDHLEQSGGLMHGRDLLEWASQVCQGMEHARARGVTCHRDLKPANILIDGGRNAKITDFGLSLAVERSLVRLGGAASPDKLHHRSLQSLGILASEGHQVCGTIGYVAPELVRGSLATVRSDIYAFGIVLWQMGAGCPVPPWLLEVDPRQGDVVSRVLQLQQRGRIPDLREPLNSIVSRCAHVDPDSRYADFSEVRESLGALYESVMGSSPVILGASREDAYYWAGRAGAMDAIGRHEDAIDCADKALALDARQKAAWHNKAMALEHLGRFTEALACLDRALEIDPSQKESWSTRGSVCSKLQRYEEGLANHDRALSIDKAYAHAWQGKANLLVKLGRREEALGCHDRDLELDPKSAHAWSCKGATLDELDRTKEAVECFRMALWIDPLHAGAWTNLGVALENRGRLADSLDCHKKACTSDPGEAAVWYNRACVERKLGFAKEAARSYGKFLALKPGHLPKEMDAALAYLKDNGVRASIHDAVEWGDVDEVQAMLRSDPRLLHAREERSGHTPLHSAAEQGQVDVARLLLAVGAEVNATDSSGETPLITATGEHGAEMAFLLLSKGADPCAASKVGDTALHFAAVENLDSVAEALLSKGAQVNALNKSGESPLDIARRFASKDVERVLLKHGARPSGRFRGIVRALFRR